MRRFIRKRLRSRASGITLCSAYNNTNMTNVKILLTY